MAGSKWQVDAENESKPEKQEEPKLVIIIIAKNKAPYRGTQAYLNETLFFDAWSM